MSPQMKLSDRPPLKWLGCISLLPQEAALIVLHLPKQLPIRQRLQVTAARAAAKARKLNSAPGTL
jgi:hypothetical protein